RAKRLKTIELHTNLRSILKLSQGNRRWWCQLGKRHKNATGVSIGDRKSTILSGCIRRSCSQQPPCRSGDELRAKRLRVYSSSPCRGHQSNGQKQLLISAGTVRARLLDQPQATRKVL